MCGDGTNDVAALGAADVGVALLTGFGLRNTDDNTKTASAPATTATTATSSSDPRKDTLELDDDTSAVHVGDASIAAPFTARRPSIGSVVDLIRHGRAAQAMVALNFRSYFIDAMITGYMSSVLYFAHIRYSQAQLIALDVLGSFASAGLTTVPPHEHKQLSARRLSRSVFPLPAVISLLSQLAIHVLGLHLGVSSALQESTSPYRLEPSTNATAPASSYHPFVPNAVSDIAFYAMLVQAGAVPLCNYLGPPFLPSFFGPSLSLVSVPAMTAAALAVLGSSQQAPAALYRLLGLLKQPLKDRTTGFIITLLSVLGFSLCAIIFRTAGTS
jgi:manganese-transporting P-type ATPase